MSDEKPEDDEFQQGHLTPVNTDPCPNCGHKLVRIADNIPSPKLPGEAWSDWGASCVMTQTRKWNWCGTSGFLTMSFERRSEDSFRIPDRRLRKQSVD